MKIMAIAIGLLLISGGVLLAWAWWSAFLAFLQGLIVFSLLLWGLASLVVGVANLKSKRQRYSALRDEPSSLEGKSD